MKIRVYGASKLKDSKVWLTMRDDYADDVELVSRWPTEFAGKVPDTPEFARKFWTIDEEDVRNCEVLFIFPPTNPHAPLRGALVEAGMAIALGKPVFVIGKCPDYGTWQYHPLVLRVDTLWHAVQKAKELVRS